jgi:hypothetical protein
MTESQNSSPTRSRITFPFLDNKSIPLNTLLKVDVSDQNNVIKDVQVKEAIASLAASTFSGTLEYNEIAKRTAYISDKMDWDLINKQGKFMVRLDNFMFKTYKVNLSDYAKKNIAKVLEEEYPPAKTYYFDIDVSLNWLKGEFGDYHSCFFAGDIPGSEFHAMKTYEGFYALRFFKPYKLSTFPELAIKYLQGNYPYSYYIEGDTIYRGYARNWMRYGIGVEYPTIFNSYGHNISVASQILRSYLGQDKLVAEFASVYNTGMFNNGDGRVIKPVGKSDGKTMSINCSTNIERKTFIDYVTIDTIKATPLTDDPYDIEDDDFDEGPEEDYPVLRTEGHDHYVRMAA